MKLFERFPLLKSSTLNKVFLNLVREGKTCAVESLSQAMKACVLASILDEAKRPILIIAGAGQEEWTLKNDLDFFVKGSILELPAWETLPSEGIAPSPEIVGARFQALDQLSKVVSGDRPKVVLTTLQACLQKVIPIESAKKVVLRLETGKKANFEKVQNQLQEMGYRRSPVVSEKGDFAVRGGLLDVFPSHLSVAYRIEFFGDSVDSIRTFDNITQKSTGLSPSVEILPNAEEQLLSKYGEAVSIFSYLPKETIVILDDLELLEDRWASLVSLGAKSSQLSLGIEEIFSEVEKFQRIYFSKNALEMLSPEISRPVQGVRRSGYSDRSPGEPVTFSMFSRQFHATRWNHPFETTQQLLARESFHDEVLEPEELLGALATCSSGVDCRFFVQSDVEERSLETKLKEVGYEKPIVTERGYLSSGFGLRDISLLLFPMTELTGRIKVRKETVRRSFSPVTSDAFDLTPGDTVVHFNHGIGRFIGIETRPNIHGVVQEFFTLEYAEGSRLFVPLAQAHLLSKYIGTREDKPTLHTLGANRWQKLREKTEKEIVGYADKLLKSYAARTARGGHVCPADSEMMRQFEEEFSYVETDDQLRAIADVKTDMCSTKAMDRLICGDVGYGKTEVAMRAAFKAVVDGKKQVAVLVPTTVLAMQHYETFAERMAPFGVRVGVLSRFKTPKETRKTIEQLATGDIDIVVGTHRLVSKDIIFKDLGLTIIDEEQRFGVKVKEHLKFLTEGVDVLTLSATPIPRTLYMSLVGARDLSTISTPPQERVPIKTVIAEPSEQLIQTALIRELNRDGQAYFIHNRVETIYDTQTRLQGLLPKARIGVAHGQMAAHELDLVFHAFKKGELDVLVATSIVESGIDIPNANTMIIDRADYFGIADLYQLRGRVGRWNRRAFAYFLIPRSKVLPEVTRKRIEAIAQSGGWGGGLKVAMRDLELRGAGDILGLEQSGHVSSVGFYLYCKLLKRAVESLQGKAPSYSADVKVEVSFDAKFPEHYVNDLQIRCELYQRLGESLSVEEVNTLFDEVVDRFGKLPEQALWLRAISRVRSAAAKKGITLIKLEKVTVTIEKKRGGQQELQKVLVNRITTPDQFEKALMPLL